MPTPDPSRVLDTAMAQRQAAVSLALDDATVEPTQRGMVVSRGDRTVEFILASADLGTGPDTPSAKREPAPGVPPNAPNAPNTVQVTVSGRLPPGQVLPVLAGEVAAQFPDAQRNAAVRDLNLRPEVVARVEHAAETVRRGLEPFSSRQPDRLAGPEPFPMLAALHHAGSVLADAGLQPGNIPAGVDPKQWASLGFLHEVFTDPSSVYGPGLRTAVAQRVPEVLAQQYPPGPAGVALAWLDLVDGVRTDPEVRDEQREALVAGVTAHATRIAAGLPPADAEPVLARVQQLTGTRIATVIEGPWGRRAPQEPAAPAEDPEWVAAGVDPDPQQPDADEDGPVTPEDIRFFLGVLDAEVAGQGPVTLTRRMIHALRGKQGVRSIGREIDRFRRVLAEEFPASLTDQEIAAKVASLRTRVGPTHPSVPGGPSPTGPVRPVHRLNGQRVYAYRLGFERFAGPRFAGDRPSAEVVQAARDAARILADQARYAAMREWIASPNPQLRVPGMAGVAVLPDGTVLSGTSVRTPSRPGYQPAFHPIVAETLSAGTSRRPGARPSANCAEPHLLSEAGYLLERRYAAAGLDPAAVEARVRQDLAATVVEVSQIGDGQFGEHGQLRLPCQCCDAVLHELGVVPAYVYEVLDHSLIDPQRRLVVLASDEAAPDSEEARLRRRVDQLSSLDPAWRVEAIHATIENGRLKAPFGPYRLEIHELNRVLEVIGESHPQLAGRNSLLIICYAGAEHPQDPLSFAQFRAEDGNIRVVASTEQVNIHRSGELWAGPEPSPNQERDAADQEGLWVAFGPDGPEPEPAGYREVSSIVGPRPDPPRPPEDGGPEWVSARQPDPDRRGTATVVPGTHVDQEMAAGSTGPPMREQVETLWRLLNERWSGEGLAGQLPPGDAFVRGVEPLDVVHHAGQPVAVKVRVHRWRGRPVDATIQFGQLDPALRAETTISNNPRTTLDITISSRHPAGDDLLVTLAHELAEADTLLRRRRWPWQRLSARTPEHQQPNILSAASTQDPRTAELSPHDVGGIADLVTKLFQLGRTATLADRARLVRDITAIRRHLGLEPGQADARWRRVYAEVAARLPVEARLYLDALSQDPQWERRITMIETAGYLADSARAPLVYRQRRVEVVSPNEIKVWWHRSQVHVRVEPVAADSLPEDDSRNRYDLQTDEAQGVITVRLSEDLARDPGAVAAAVSAAAAESQAKLMQGRLWRNRVGALSQTVEVTAEQPRLAPWAKPQWRLAVRAARRVAELTKAVDKATGPEADRLRDRLAVERQRLWSMMRVMGLLEGRRGAEMRRYAIDRTRSAAPTTPEDAVPLNPWVRLSPNQAAVQRTLEDLARLVAEQVDGVRGARLVTPKSGDPQLVVVLDDTADVPRREWLRTYRLTVSFDAVTGQAQTAEDFAELDSAELDQRKGKLRLRDDASRAALARDLAAALAELVQRRRSADRGHQPDHADQAVAIARARAKLRVLDLWYPLAGELAQPAIAAAVDAEVEALRQQRQHGNLPAELSQWRDAVIEGGSQLVRRMLGRANRRPGRQERHVEARRIPDEIPAPWKFFPGRMWGATVSSVTNYKTQEQVGTPPYLIGAESVATFANNFLQGWQDGKLRRSDYRDSLARKWRQAAAKAAAAAAAGSAKDTRPVEPLPRAWPFFEKRTVPTSSAGLLGMYLWIGTEIWPGVDAYGPEGMVGAGPQLANAAGTGFTDWRAERGVRQAKADRGYALRNRPDRTRDEALTKAYYEAAELRHRLVMWKVALHRQFTNEEKDRLLADLRQAHESLRLAREAFRPVVQQYREEIHNRRRLGRLLLQGFVLGPIRTFRTTFQSGYAAGRRVFRRLEQAAEPHPLAVPPDRAWVERTLGPAVLSNLANLAMRLALVPDKMAFYLFLTAGSIGAALGLGQGWADQNRDAVADELPLAAIKADRHAADALKQLEHAVQALGEQIASATGADLPAKDPSDVDIWTHFLLKHGPAFVHRLGGLFAVGTVLHIDPDLLMNTLKFEAAKQFAFGTGEAIFRKLAESDSRRQTREAAERQAHQLAYDLGELATKIRDLAAEARQAAGVQDATTVGERLAQQSGSNLSAEDLAEELNGWSDPQRLAEALNSKLGTPNAWQGEFYSPGSDSAYQKLLAPGTDRIGAVVRTPGKPARMVVIEATRNQAGEFPVWDPSRQTVPGGVSYSVDDDWIKQNVVGAVYRR